MILRSTSKLSVNYGETARFGSSRYGCILCSIRWMQESKRRSFFFFGFYLLSWCVWMPQPPVALVSWFRRRIARTQFIIFAFCSMCLASVGIGKLVEKEKTVEEKKQHKRISGTQSGTSISRSENGAKHTPIHSRTRRAVVVDGAVLLHSS